MKTLLIFPLRVLLTLLLLTQAGCQGDASLGSNEVTHAQVRRDSNVIGEFSLEIAKTPAERSKGLMYRKQMDPDAGMIFVYPREHENIFWMKNTYIPLDMLFLNREKKVVGILSDVPVLNLEQRTVGKPSQFVIELNAGRAKALGIREGDVFAFDKELQGEE